MGPTKRTGARSVSGQGLPVIPDNVWRRNVEELLPLALSQPQQALAIANRLIEHDSDPARRSIAHQAAGIVLRDQGQGPEAVAQFEAALRLSRRMGDTGRAADVLASLGVALVGMGKTGAGLARFDEALTASRGVLRSRVQLRLAVTLLQLGRPHDALGELRAAIRGCRKANDRLWEARCLVNRSWAYGVTGDPVRAEQDALDAERLFAQLGQFGEATLATHNRGMIAFVRGDLPRALALLDLAERRAVTHSLAWTRERAARLEVLITAGLAPEALEAATALVNDPGLAELVRPEVQLRAGGILVVTNEARRGEQLGESARATFAAQGRPAWRNRADWLIQQARYQQGQRDRSLLSSLQRICDRLRQDGAPEAAQALLLAAELARHLGRPTWADAALSTVASGRRAGPPLTRAAAWLAAALLAESTRNRRVLLRACSRGLDAIDEHRTFFGDTELRALATAQGRQLVQVALDAVVTARPSSLLSWTERWRATALTATPVRPPHDLVLATALAAAREAGHRLADAPDASTAAAQAERDRARHEAQVRRRYQQLSDHSGGLTQFHIAGLVEAVGSDALVSLVDVRGVLYAVLVTNGRVTRHEVGSSRVALRESEFARFTLRRTAYGRMADLARAGALAQAALLGDLAAKLPQRVVVVPPAALHAAPWGMLPMFAETRLSVAPSARLWLQARARPSPRSRKVTFVTGPGLTSEATEATTVSSSYAGATVLSGDDATVAATVPALEGARLAHIAAHGSFRADAPMFSSLHLADGPLYIHDLDRLRHPPHTLILSACDAGDTAAVGVDEGLGLVTSLLGLGTSAVLASVVPVNDQATIPVMALVHSRLAAGAELSSALRDARVEMRGDPTAYASAVSFTAWAP